MPTLLSIAGYDMTTLPQNIDGMDQWPVLSAANNKGVSNSNSNRTFIALNLHSQQILRRNDIKTITRKAMSMDGIWVSTTEQPELYIYIRY